MSSYTKLNKIICITRMKIDGICKQQDMVKYMKTMSSVKYFTDSGDDNIKSGIQSLLMEVEEIKF